ncbi:hypothetical protein SCH01S_25_00740 [Sphingomonas changbaiensis NBRC 104936]|uniref:Lipoprotein n=1 Tax=Sphingomonas changbaiensis NBRC 104936 TaxID=1219043 RepID=A0A0E9MNI0_9SPHN|nr:hypothetical protein [Sphingomonas changbaiensis]GAO39094.1 hypothetical protein SCH01S_25_00740 [Sphingomonas changbaiensis NBRC 104936]
MVRLSALLISLALLGACSSSGRDKIADKVEDNADNRAAAMDQASDEMTNALRADAVQQQANIVRSAGEDRAQAIRDSDLDANALTREQKNALIAGRPTGTQAGHPR